MLCWTDALTFLDTIVADNAMSAASDASSTVSDLAFEAELQDVVALDSLSDVDACTPSATRIISDSDDDNDTAAPVSSANFSEPGAGRLPRPRRRRSALYDPNRARNARRHELNQLRYKVAEMEQQLKQLQSAAQDVSREVHGQSASTTLRQQSLWEKVARRQRDERRRIEGENAHLRAVLDVQLKVSQSLKTLLYRRATKGMGEFGLINQTQMFAPHTKQPDRDTFEELLRQVDTWYTQVDSVLGKLGIGEATDCACRDAKLKDDGDQGVHIEVFMSDQLPFALHDTSRAAWKYFSQDKNQMPSRLDYERISENQTHTEDTILESLFIEDVVNNVRAVSHVKQVIRRYIEEDRMVIASCAVFEPVTFACKRVKGCVFRERGCIVLQKSPTHGGESTLMKTCYVATPNTSRPPSSPYSIDFFLQTSAAMVNGWYQRIENILIDQQQTARHIPHGTTNS